MVLFQREEALLGSPTDASGAVFIQILRDPLRFCTNLALHEQGGEYDQVGSA